MIITQNMKLLIFKSRLSAFEPVDKACRSDWLGKTRVKHVGVDRSVAAYIAHKYPDITVHYKDPFKVNLNDYDAVYLGLEYWSMSHVLYEQGDKALRDYKKLLLSVVDRKKLIVPPAFVEFSHDKCAFNRKMRALKIPVAPTKCVAATKNTNLRRVYDSIRRTAWGKKSGQKVFAKPIPGEGSHDIFSFETFEEFERGFSQVLDQKIYTHVVFQRYMPDFATDKHPELRTYWVGDEYQVGVRTTTLGYYAGRIKRLPSTVRQHTQRMIRHFEKTFGFSFVCARFDWGFDKDIGYFINELELLPGFFNEELSEHNLPDCKWNLDAKIGDRIYQIIQKK
jgi:hypothetical protein